MPTQTHAVTPPQKPDSDAQIRLARHYEVVILGGGMAGLTLARQLLLETDRKILLLDRRPSLPPGHQKVGESTVQLTGYYLSKVLDLEEHLVTDHYLKYNLRFHWPIRGKATNSAAQAGKKVDAKIGDDYADYSQAYIRKMSNIASYQLDRNRLEAELLRLNEANPRFTLGLQCRRLDVTLHETASLATAETTADASDTSNGLHRVRFALGPGNGGRTRSVTAEWVVDCSGRGRYLARKLDLTRDSQIKHGASFAWVDGLINLETLTRRSPSEVRLSRDRKHLGHLPMWLATNHFMGQGFWLWVIPLHGGTSLGLVYDTEEVSREEVAGPEKLIAWICERFPLFVDTLKGREVRSFGGYIDYAYDCACTLSADRWAMSGEAGRFSDPLYSPGGDLISLHNTLITDAILTEDPAALPGKVAASEQLLRSFYEAYLPSFKVSYDALGDQEAFVLKYTWELTVYFAFYVFPFINDLFTDRRFTLAYLNRFARLGPLNRNVQNLLSAFYRWKVAAGRVGTESPVFVDFFDLGPLSTAEGTFYDVGVTTDEGKKILSNQLANLRELALYITAYVCAAVVGHAGALTNASFIATLDPADFVFDADEIRKRWRQHISRRTQHQWSFDPWVLEAFRHHSPFGVGLEHALESSLGGRS